MNQNESNPVRDEKMRSQVGDGERKEGETMCAILTRKTGSHWISN